MERVAVCGDGDGVLKLDKWTLAVLGDQWKGGGAGFPKLPILMSALDMYAHIIS